MGTVIKWHIHARTAVLRGSRAARTSSVIPFTRRFFAISSTKNQLAAGIEPRARHVEIRCSRRGMTQAIRERGGGLLLDCYNFADVLALEDDRGAQDV